MANVPKVMPMTTGELLDAIKKAKEVHVYVPVNDYFLEVVVAKTKLVRAIQERINEFPFSFDPVEWMAEWIDDILIVGGDSYDPED
jgi:hypothetical protein